MSAEVHQPKKDSDLLSISVNPFNIGFLEGRISELAKSEKSGTESGKQPLPEKVIEPKQPQGIDNG